jgi:uncharacterized protein (UPF0264 family)
MAGLLVSVRSADEARAAVDGGASVVDVKEPDRGPLGRSTVAICRAVREVVPTSIPVSVALGELRDWEGEEEIGPSAFEGIAFRKLGLAGAGPRWIADWAAIRGEDAGGPRWVAVAYADWRIAGAPDPEAVLGAAMDIPVCAGVLVDTWDKSRVSPLEASPFWSSWVDRAHRGGRFVALAGGLDLAAIARLAPLRPDLFAVRGAACIGSDRRGTVDIGRVAELARAVKSGL